MQSKVERQISGLRRLLGEGGLTWDESTEDRFGFGFVEVLEDHGSEAVIEVANVARGLENHAVIFLGAAVTEVVAHAMFGRVEFATFGAPSECATTALSQFQNCCDNFLCG